MRKKRNGRPLLDSPFYPFCSFFNKVGVNPHNIMATAITINPVKKEPPAIVTRFPMIIGEMIPPMNAPILITA